MLQIRPVSDLRNNFTELEGIVNGGEPIFLTKNGYGSMVLLSLENYAQLTDQVEIALDEADQMAEMTSHRYTHEEVFGNLRRMVNG